MIASTLWHFRLLVEQALSFKQQASRPHLKIFINDKLFYLLCVKLKVLINILPTFISLKPLALYSGNAGGILTVYSPADVSVINAR